MSRDLGSQSGDYEATAEVFCYLLLLDILPYSSQFFLAFLAGP